MFKLDVFFFLLYKLFHSSGELLISAVVAAASLQHGTQEGQYNLYNYCGGGAQVYKCNKEA